MKTRVFATVSAIWAILFGSSVFLKADVVVTVNQTGANVVWSSSGGAFDLTGLTFDGNNFATGFGQGFSDASSASFVLGSGNPVDYWGGVNSPGNYGPGGLVLNSCGLVSGIGYGASSTLYGIPSDAILVPTGYVSGGTLGATSSTYTNQSLASMGLTPGIYVWTWGQGGANQSLTLRINAIPEPASAGVLGIAIVGATLLGRRKRRN